MSVAGTKLWEPDLNITPEALEEMRVEVYDRIIIARVGLLLRHPFFGNMATRLRILAADDWLPTAAVDGRNLYYNTQFFNAMSNKEIEFVIAHEILHCVFDHMQARGDRKPMLYNAAADYNINMTLVEQNIGKPITEDKLEGGKICLDWKYSGWNSYEIYDDLLKNQQDAKGMDVHMDEIQPGDEDGEGGQGVEMSEEEKKALELHLFSGDIRKYGLTKAMKRQNSG